MKKLKYLCAFMVLLLVLLRPQASVDGAQRAMRLWYESVAPALFPFLALMPVLTGADACAAYERALGGIMMRLFRLPGSAAPAMIIGMIAGSPGGALALRRVAGQSGMEIRDARRIALAVCGVSPAYLILGVGHGLYGSVSMGIRLALVQLITQLLLLRVLDGGEDASPAPAFPESENRGWIGGAVEHLLAVCGCMVFFGSVCNVLGSFIGNGAGIALRLVVDLPTGLAALREWNLSGRMLIQGAAIGFGGICIGAQNMGALREIGIRWKDYLAARVTAAVIQGCAAGLLPSFAGTNTFHLSQGGNAYAFSLLAAGICMLPVLNFLSKKFFLNKRN